jgi:hypothetical protein
MFGRNTGSEKLRNTIYETSRYFQNNMIKKRIITTISFIFFGALTGVASAQDCAWLPPFLCNLVANDNPVTDIEVRIRVAFFIAIGVIILIAIAYGLYNAYKYIKGGGEGMEDANKGMRAILFGIGSIFVILLGIAAVLLFFGANFLQVWLAPSCIAAPDGAGCYACQNQGEGANADTCRICNTNPNTSGITVAPPSDTGLAYDTNNDGGISENEIGSTALNQPVTNVSCGTLVQETR